MKIKTLESATMMVMTAALLAGSSCSSEPEQKEANDSPTENSTTLSQTGRGGVVIDTMQSVSIVQSVNISDRTVVLRHSDGRLSKVECGPEVRNFDQIKAGDRITATVAESLALSLTKGNDVPMGASSTTAVIRSPAGAKPGGKIVDTVGFTAQVTKVDVPNRRVTLQTADGDSETIKVGPEIDLANISPGDHVGVRATRAFAITIKEPEK